MGEDGWMWEVCHGCVLDQEKGIGEDDGWVCSSWRGGDLGMRGQGWGMPEGAAVRRWRRRRSVLGEVGVCVA